MAHTHTLLLYHLVFSTKHRAPLLTPEIRESLFPYMCGIIENNGGSVLIVNGVVDHVHMLCRLKTTPALADVVHAVKGSSAAWWNSQHDGARIHWQEGYGAFSVSPSMVDRTHRYIRNQENHHRTRTFEQEYEAILSACGLDYDSRFHLD